MLSQREKRLSTKVHQGSTAATTSARAGALLGFFEIAENLEGAGWAREERLILLRKQAGELVDQ
jgi:hypothetical protein